MRKDDPERAARMAEALRANLRRRKAQAREVGDGDSSTGNSREGGNPPGDESHTS
jgi:hypothetical protein